jgi:hypothetical protein
VRSWNAGDKCPCSCQRQAVLLNAAGAQCQRILAILVKVSRQVLFSRFCIGAGLGGVALGAIPGSMGVPGFSQQNLITDPEYPGSSNTNMARASTPTLRYLG